MQILSLICANLLCVNAHLFHRVAAHHFKVYICGSRNGIAILDSDKTLICLRNALLFLGSPIRQKGRYFSLHTNNRFIYEIFSEMAGFIKGSHWKIGAFLNHSFSRKNPFRSRNNKIIFGFNQKPDCVLLMDADRKSSVILKADRSQIPIVSFVDYTTPLASLKRITYPIPGNPNLQFIYQLGNFIAKISSSKLIYTRSTPKGKGGSYRAAFEAARGPIIWVIKLLYPLLLNFLWGTLCCGLLGFLPDGALLDLNQPAEPASPDGGAAPASPPHEVAEPPAAPLLPLNGLEAAAHRIVLFSKIKQSIEKRVSEVYGCGVGDDLRRATAQRVLHSIEMEDEMDIQTLAELLERLQQQPELLDELVEDFILSL